MKAKGTDGVMLARNRVRRLLNEKGKPDALACELTRDITCCDEGLTVGELFSREEAEMLAAQCELTCPVPPETPAPAA